MPRQLEVHGIMYFIEIEQLKRSWDIIISKRNAKNYINDVEVAVQRANTASVEFGISERRYIKTKHVIFKSAAIKQGVELVWFTT